MNCAALVALLDQVPDRLITLSGGDRAALIESRAAVAMMMQPRGDLAITRVVHRGESPLKIIWRLMRECPDEFPDPKLQLVPFVKDAELRNSINADIGAAHAALANDEFKGATVLAGSAIEALLLWALQDDRIFPKLAALVGVKPPASKADLESFAWGLDTYIKAAAEIGLVDGNGPKALELTKDYRNLIHPGRSKRLSAVCNRGTAHGAIAAPELLIPMLAKALP